MATKTIALSLKIDGNAELTQAQANLDQLRRSLKQVNDQEKKGIITAKEANKARADLNVNIKASRNALVDQQNAILKNNDALKKNSGFVAGVRKGVGQWATSMIGVTAAIAAGTKIISSMVSVVVDFSKSTSTLASVLGKTKGEIKALSDQAKQLGATTAFTASEVVELQTEFAKLGFPEKDIQNMTASTLDAAAALGSELGEQAALTGAVLKGYGLDSTEAARVNDVLAKSASSSALDFSKLSTALPIVGATAKTAGVDLERTTALLGTLSDRGIDASTAATSLRNIFLELSKKGLTFEEAMAKISTATDKNAVAMDLFGKRSATAGIIIAEAGGSIDKLEETLRGAEGAAKEMADTMLDNLAGDITKAGSAWEGFILSLEDGEGVFSQISRSFTQAFTDIFDTLTRLNNGDFEGIGERIIGDAKGINDRITLTDKLTGKVTELSITQNDLFLAAKQNEEIFNALNSAYKNGEIDISKYEAGIRNLADGYQALTAEQKHQQRVEADRAELKAIEDEENAKLQAKLVADNAAAEAEEKANEKREKAAADSAKREAEARRKEEEKAFEDKKNRAIQAQKELEQLAIQSITDERTRERLSTAAKFDDKIAALKQDGEEEKALALALEQSKRDALKTLDEKFKAEDEAKKLEERALELENNLIKAGEDLEQQNLILEEQKQLELSNQELTDAERTSISLKYDQQIADNTKKLTEIKKQEQLAALSVVAGAFDAIASLAEEGSNEAKALATVSAIINSYLAYTNALANTPAPAPFPQIAAASALLSGLAQVKKINSTKKAAKGMYLENGGMINGASHANGGVPFTVDGRSGFEAEGGEAIINKRSTEMFRPLLSQINEAGGGVAFARGGLVSKFQTGGLTPSATGVTATQLALSSNGLSIEELGQTIVSGINDKEVINVATSTSDVAADAFNVRNVATF